MPGALEGTARVVSRAGSGTGTDNLAWMVTVWRQEGEYNPRRHGGRILPVVKRRLFVQLCLEEGEALFICLEEALFIRQVDINLAEETGWGIDIIVKALAGKPIWDINECCN